jgi:hypothetical protein
MIFHGKVLNNQRVPPWVAPLRQRSVDLRKLVIRELFKLVEINLIN